LHIRVLRLQNIDYSMVVLVLHSNFAMTGCHATSICWSVALSPWHQGITTVSMPVRECPHHAPARYPAFSHAAVCIIETNVLWHDSMGLCDNCAMFVLTTACQADGYVPWEWYYHLSAAKRQGKLVCKGSCGMSADISVTPWCHNRIVSVVILTLLVVWSSLGHLRDY
jgi:hypothetical protein